MKRSLFLAGTVFVTATPGLAADNTANLAGADSIDSIIVTGSRGDPKLMPGSASLVDDADLRLFDYGDVHRVLRRVPGVNIQEEEGFGLFPNIGLRGTSVDRSDGITIMEDGVLIAPAPYSAPAAYYFPSVGRMHAVEVVKGAAAVRYGPRTIGGAINLRSTPIPVVPFGGLLSGQYGEDNHYVVQARAGGSNEHFGAMLETYQAGSGGFKRLDGGGDTGFERQDYIAKLRADTGDDFAVPMSLEFKYARTTTDARETYLGLSDLDFAATPYRRYAASGEDDFKSKHDQFMLTHRMSLGAAEIATIGYYNDFARNWHKLNDLNLGDGRGFISPQVIFDDPTSPANAPGLAILRGEANSAPAALRVRNNNRNYYSRGVQTAAKLPFTVGRTRHTLEASLRYHEDEEDRLQNDERFQMVDGSLVLTRIDPLGSNANREAKAKATAFYVQDTIEIGSVTLTPGLRHERIDLVRLDYGTGDPTRAAGPTRVRRTTIDAWLPALGATWRLNDAILLLGGVSRGFSPPGPGNPDAREEKSWNYEFGARYGKGAWQGSLIGFFNDYSNLLGNCTNAVGCTTGDIGDQFNGGAVDAKGIEAAVEGSIPLSTGLRIPLSANYTHTNAEFRQSFVSEFFGDVTKGDALPYVPRHQAYVSAGLAAERWSLVVAANYVGAVRTEPGHGSIPEQMKVPGRTVFDLAGRYAITESIGLFGRADNLFDKDYAVARRPLGLRPGKPRTIIAGLEFRF